MNLRPIEITGIYSQLAVRIFFFLCAYKINFFSFDAELLIYPYKTKSLLIATYFCRYYDISKSSFKLK